MHRQLYRCHFSFPCRFSIAAIFCTTDGTAFCIGAFFPNHDKAGDNSSCPHRFIPASLHLCLFTSLPFFMDAATKPCGFGGETGRDTTPESPDQSDQQLSGNCQCDSERRGCRHPPCAKQQRRFLPTGKSRLPRQPSAAFRRLPMPLLAISGYSFRLNVGICRQIVLPREWLLSALAPLDKRHLFNYD